MTVPAALKELEKIEYDTAVKDLQKLLDKSDAQRKDTLWKAILKSEKTYDEILSYIESGDGVADDRSAGIPLSNTCVLFCKNMYCSLGKG